MLKSAPSGSTSAVMECKIVLNLPSWIPTHNFELFVFCETVILGHMLTNAIDFFAALTLDITWHCCTLHTLTPNSKLSVKLACSLMFISDSLLILSSTVRLETYSGSKQYGKISPVCYSTVDLTINLGSSDIKPLCARAAWLLQLFAL